MLGAPPIPSRLRPVATLDEMREAWTELAACQGNVFSTWEWADAWWRTYGEGQRLLLHEVVVDGRVIGILPLCSSARLHHHVMRFLGHGPSDQLGPVCAPEDRGRVCAALGDLLRRGDLPSVLLAERLRSDDDWPLEGAGRLVRHESFPVLCLHGMSWEEWLASRSSNFRQQVRRRERRLVREHDLSFELVTDGDDVLAALEILIELHNQRWGAQSSAFCASRRTFHRDFALAAARRGWLRLWLAHAGSEVVAAWMGFRFGGCDSYYQMGRSPQWASHNVGSVLLLRTIRDAAESGMREYRLLGGGETYKQRLTSHDPGTDTYVLGSRPLARVATGFARHKDRLPGFARRALASQLGW